MNPTFTESGLVVPPDKISAYDAYKALRAICRPKLVVLRASTYVIEATFVIADNQHDVQLYLPYTTNDIIAGTGDKTLTLNAGQDNERETAWHESDIYHNQPDQDTLLAIADCAAGFGKEVRNG